VRRLLYENSLSLFFGVLFLAALAGQSIAGQRAFKFGPTEAPSSGSDPTRQESVPTYPQTARTLGSNTLRVPDA
jgi:hypothetical protein